MRKAFWILGFCILMVVKTSMACSVHVNDNAQKNFLAAFGASHLNIALSTVSATTVSAYTRTFAGSDPVSHCPQYLDTEAVVSFTYAPAANQNCQAQVTVTRRQFIGDEPTGPIEDVDYSDLTASCSTSSSRVIRPQRPVRPVPQVRPGRPKP